MMTSHASAAEPLARARSYAERAAAEDNLFVACTYAADAWSASQRAEDLGADPWHVCEVRFRLFLTTNDRWLPQALAIAANVRDDKDRAELYLYLAHVARRWGRWFASEGARGYLTCVDVDEMAVRWSDWTDTIEMMARAPLA